MECASVLPEGRLSPPTAHRGRSVHNRTRLSRPTGTCWLGRDNNRVTPCKGDQTWTPPRNPSWSHRRIRRSPSRRSRSRNTRVRLTRRCRVGISRSQQRRSVPPFAGEWAEGPPLPTEMQTQNRPACPRASCPRRNVNSSYATENAPMLSMGLTVTLVAGIVALTLLIITKASR